jgi:YVTN family beta-propeller protein
VAQCREPLIGQVIRDANATNSAENTVSVTDTATYAVINTSAVGSAPFRVAATPDGLRLGLRFAVRPARLINDFMIAKEIGRQQRDNGQLLDFSLLSAL